MTQRTQISVLSLSLLWLVFMTSCKKEEVSPTNTTSVTPTVITITANDFSASIDENSPSGTVIGTVQASVSDNSSLTYALSNQSITGAMAIDSNTGALSIADSSVFDFEKNTRITAEYTASASSETATGNITITINDVAGELKVGDNGLIAHYTFDNTLADAMGNFPDMVFEGGDGLPDPRADRDYEGRTNKAYRILANGKYIKLANQDLLVDTDKTYTIAIWVHPEGGRQVLQPIIYKEFDHQLQVAPGVFINPVTYNSRVQYGTPSDTDAWGINASKSSLRSAPRLQTWSHLALVCDNDKLRVYVNGLEVDSKDITASSFKNSGKDLYIGAILDANGTATSRYEGRVDDLRYYNQALTPAQIEALASTE